MPHFPGTRMDRAQRRLDRARRIVSIVALLTIPGFFFGIVFCWNWIDTALGTREVSRFIRDHQPLLVSYRAHPRVHSLQLAHKPQAPWNLLISFDVDDKATYEMLEGDFLGRTMGLRFPAHWETNTRSKEELGNNFGFAAQGMGVAVNAIVGLGVAAVMSLVMSCCFLWIALRRLGGVPVKAALSE